MVDFVVTVTKDGQVLASEVVVRPTEGQLTEAINRVRMAAIQSVSPKPLWDSEITIRQVPGG